MEATISEGRVSARPSRPAVGGGEKAELTWAQSLFPHPKGQRQQAARHGVPAPSGPGGPHPNRRQFLRSHPTRRCSPPSSRWPLSPAGHFSRSCLLRDPKANAPPPPGDSSQNVSVPGKVAEATVSERRPFQRFSLHLCLLRGLQSRYQEQLPHLPFSTVPIRGRGPCLSIIFHPKPSQSAKTSLLLSPSETTKEPSQHSLGPLSPWPECDKGCSQRTCLTGVSRQLLGSQSAPPTPFSKLV